MTTAPERPAIQTVFDISRDYQADLERVWRAWSQAELLSQWWGPPGCAVEVKRLEFRAGGFFHYAMNFSNAPTLFGRFTYRDIVPNQRLVWLNSFANERGGIARAPFSEVCPLEIENTVTFSSTGGITTVALHAAPFGATDAETAFFAELCSSGGLAQGYGGTFDQLAVHLRN